MLAVGYFWLDARRSAYGGERRLLEQQLLNSETSARVAVLIPCYNESQTIAKVIRDFRAQLPSAEIYVYDNNSADDTARIAADSGAVVKHEFRQGKGNVVRRMFRDIEADVYLMVDGDDTYPAEACHSLIQLVGSGVVDMAVGDRISDGSYSREIHRAFHGFGNKLVKSMINLMFRSKLSDIMSGYRCFSRRFVKTMPVMSPGFEIETEMTLHALDKRFYVKETPIEYRDRPEGSVSKLSTYSDGLKVIRTIFMMFKNFRPLAFFSLAGLLLFVLGLMTGVPVIIEYAHHRFIYRVPMAILSTGIMILSALSFVSGLILDTVVKQHRCLYELALSNYAGSVVVAGDKNGRGEVS